MSKKTNPNSYEGYLKEYQDAQAAYNKIIEPIAISVAKAQVRINEAKEKLIAAIGSKDGTTTLVVGNFNCKTTGGFSYTVDADNLDDVEEALNEFDDGEVDEEGNSTFDNLFRFKGEVNVKYMKELKKHNKKAFKIASKAITSKDKAVTLKVEEKKEEK